MTRSQLREKIAGFNHGMDSHGNLLTPWRHEKDCVMCDRLTEFIDKILEDYNEAVGVVYPKEDEINSRKEKCEPSHLFNCPACKVQGYCDGGGFCLHETHSFK